MTFHGASRTLKVESTVKFSQQSLVPCSGNEVAKVYELPKKNQNVSTMIDASGFFPYIYMEKKKYI